MLKELYRNTLPLSVSTSLLSMPSLSPDPDIISSLKMFFSFGRTKSKKIRPMNLTIFLNINSLSKIFPSVYRLILDLSFSRMESCEW